MTDEITERKRTATLVSRSLAGGVTALGILVAFEHGDASPSRLLVILVLTLLTGLLIRSSIELQQISFEHRRRPTNVDRRAVLARNVPFLLVGVVPAFLFALAALGLIPFRVALVLSRWMLAALLFGIGVWASRLMGFGPWVNLLDGLRVGIGGILLVLLAHFWK